jgi:hypothetical protein
MRTLIILIVSGTFGGLLIYGEVTNPPVSTHQLKLEKDTMQAEMIGILHIDSLQTDVIKSLQKEIDDLKQHHETKN